MLRLVTTNNVDVFRHLGSPAFQRLGIETIIASSYDEAQALIRRHRPRIVLLDTALAGGNGFDLCRSIKDDPELKGTHIAMILSSLITRADLDRVQSSGCDDVLALPLHSDDFYHHLAQVAGVPFRRDRRIGVSLDIVVTRGGEPVPGEVVNVGAGGVGVLVPAVLERGAQIAVRFHHDGQDYPDARATVAWCNTEPVQVPQDGDDRRDADGDDEAAPPQPAFLAGLSFPDDLPLKVRLLFETLALYDVAAVPDGGGVTVSLQGDFTEMTRFDGLAQRLAGEARVDFHAAAVRYISSAGVRAWCQFLDGLDGKQYTFRQCSIAFASQAAMVPMVVGHGAVLSLEAPYLCETCDREELRLLETRALLREGGRVLPPQLSCSTCGGELVFDDVPDRYFAFLRDAP